MLALVAVDDLFDAMQLLRLAYSGIAPDEAMNLSDRIGTLRPGGSKRQNKLLLAEGFGLLDGRLMTLMGHKATASMGAVVAHHTAPFHGAARTGAPPKTPPRRPNARTRAARKPTATHSVCACSSAVAVK